MTKNEIVGRLKGAGLDASSINRSAAVYVTDAIERRAKAGLFAFRIICDSEKTERRVRDILSRWYDIDENGDVWSLKSKNRIPLIAIKKGAAPPSNSYMYLEAAQANSTVRMVSTLETAPKLEYSTDGVMWQEWEHTTVEGTHTFDIITLGAVGDRVYFRGDNPNGIGYIDEDEDIWKISIFYMTGLINAGGNVTSILDKTMTLTEVPAFGLFELFYNDEADTALLTPPSMDTITSIGKDGCSAMYYGCTYLTSAADMPLLSAIGDGGCEEMYCGCTFDMSDDGKTLNFAFPTPPVTAGDTTYATAYNVASWMGNTNGF